MNSRLQMASVPEPETMVVGGIVRRHYRIPAGMILLAHTHDYDHLSVLYTGHARLKAGENISDLIGPAMVVIKAGIEHSLLALDDCIWDCLHNFERARDAHSRGDPYAFLGVKEK